VVHRRGQQEAAAVHAGTVERTKAKINPHTLRPVGIDGAEYDDRIDAASELWEALPAAQQDLTARGVRFHPAFLQWAADVEARQRERRETTVAR
jgi:hypothetical protein